MVQRYPRLPELLKSKGAGVLQARKPDRDLALSPELPRRLRRKRHKTPLVLRSSAKL